MPGPSGMAIGAGPLYVNAIMGQGPSATEREYARKANSTILREDFIQVEESENISRADSWSMHCDNTTQAPYSPANTDDMMMTQDSLLKIPRDNASHDLAFFLRTTGPTAPHRRPSRLERPRKAVYDPRNALRFLKISQKRSSTPDTIFDDRLNGVLHDEGGLLADVPKVVEQKVSSTGKKYLALQVPTEEETKVVDNALTLSPSIFESEVSVSFADSMNSSEVLDTWFYTTSMEQWSRKPVPHRKASEATDNEPHDKTTVRVVDDYSSPVRPAASNPPSPEPESAVSGAESYRSDRTCQPVQRQFDASRALSSHPVNPAVTSSSLPLPQISLPHEECPVRHPGREKEVEIKHPSPRRFASHPVLLQRASSIASSLYPRSVSDSPGPPPPRSPLRLRRDPRTIEGLLTSDNDGKSVPKMAPSILDVKEYKTEIQPIKPSVVTDCTGPIKRPRSRGKTPVAHPAYPASRKEREERIRARKFRDRPFPTGTIDAVVDALPPIPRQRLKKARPHIQIPDLRPAPLTTRGSASTSSNASWKKITDYTRTPVSAVPSEHTSISAEEKTGYTPISPTASNETAVAERGMALSPVMLVAEEMPVPKAKSPSKPAKLIVKEGKSYAPRPRSASIPRGALKRQSRQGVQTPTRAHTPEVEREKDDTPPLPSPPPSRALPPTPPASGSEKPKKVKTSENKKELPSLPPCEITPESSTSPKRNERAVPHVATQVQRKTAWSKDSAKSSNVHARLEALEKQNALLEAALSAVLKTNGSMNNALARSDSSESPRTPTAWESRMARRSAASHAASSSNGSALEMYMSTRRGSKHGR